MCFREEVITVTQEELDVIAQILLSSVEETMARAAAA